MPAASPELNPAEAMWDWIRKNHFGNECFDHLDKAEEAIIEAFRELDSDPKHICSTTLVPYFSKAFQDIDPRYQFL